MTDTSDLVERLTYWSAPGRRLQNDHWPIKKDMGQAAAALTAKDKEIKALRTRVKESEAHCVRLGQGGAERYWEGRWRDEAKENDQLRRERDEARAVLKPFADAASGYDDSFSDDEPTWGDYGLKLGHLRAARAVIEQGPEWHSKDHWENEP